MLKKHQKWTTLLLTITFAWLLQVSTMPLAAANTTEQLSSASIDQATGLHRAARARMDPGQKKSPTRIIIFVIIGYVALSLLYLLIHGINWEASPSAARRTVGANRGRIAIR